jgi:hypothetical protein
LALDISYHILNANKRDRKVYTNQGIATKLWLQTSTPHWYKETSSAKKKKKQRNYKFRAQGETFLSILQIAFLLLIRNTATIMQQQQELVLNDIFTTYQPKMCPTILFP